ncbi:MAG: hypothetical protein RL741_1083 [Actinomycetota bacterium]|jgi:hypothetical protein
MNSTPGDASSELDKKVQSAKRLRALLDDVELTPEQTSDDIVPKTNRDRELIDDVPPHHGNT